MQPSAEQCGHTVYRKEKHLTVHQVTTTCAHQELVQLHVFDCVSERLMCAVATLNVCELAIHTVYTLHFTGLNFRGSWVYTIFAFLFSRIKDFRNFHLCSLLPASATDVEKPSQIWDIPPSGEQKRTNGHPSWRNDPATAHMWTYKRFLSQVGFRWAWHQWRVIVCTGISSCICSPLCWFVKVIVRASPFFQLTSQAKFSRGDTFADGRWSAKTAKV